MAFTNTVLEQIPDLPAGEVIASSPHCIVPFDNFEDQLVPGKFVKLDTGRIDNMDGSATPKIVGISRRKIASALDQVNYRTAASGAIATDSCAEVINFGFATVEVPSGVTPAKYGAVYAVNAAGSAANFGKATTVATDNVAVPDCIFWEAKADGVWLVLFSRYVTGA